MKSKIKLTFCFFVPLLEVIYEEKVRKPLDFLKTSEKTCKKLEYLYHLKKNKSNSENEEELKDVVFVPRIGNIKLSITTETYNYYIRVRQHICDNEPIRPLVSFQTNHIKWKDDYLDSSFLNARKKAEIYPSLAGCITKKVTLSTNEKAKDIENRINKTLREINNQKLSEKKDLLEVVFEDYSKIFVTESDVLTIIEINSDIKYKEIFNTKKIGRIELDDCKIIFLDFSKILLIKKKTLPKIFIHRIIETLKLIFLLKMQAKRATNILDKEILSEKPLREKFEFFEFLLATLDPKIYSSVENLNILPQHYQRILFRKTSEILSFQKYSKTIKEKTAQKIKSWELREQVMFLSRGNLVVNRLKTKFKLERKLVSEPKLTQKEKALLDFLLEKYKEEVLSLGIAGLDIKMRIPAGSVSANKIREEINPWLIKKGLKTNLITETDLKKSPPGILSELNLLGLVEMKEPEKKTRTKYLYSIKESDPYIQTRLRGL